MKYINCDCCGKKIHLGDMIVQHRMYCGIYCSDKCFLISAVPDRRTQLLTLELIENCNAELKEE